MKVIKSLNVNIKATSLRGLQDAMTELQYLAKNLKSGTGFGSDNSFTIKVVTKNKKSS